MAADTKPVEHVQSIPQQEQQKVSDKELNFRALESKYQKQLEQERAARLEAEKTAQVFHEMMSKFQKPEEESDDEPYVDHKKLERKLAKTEEKIDKKTISTVEEIVARTFQAERERNWIKQNPDFYDVMQHAEKLADQDPELAETILEMPDNFERKKLVYKNVKALKLHQPAQKAASIQDKIDSNRKMHYYQPSGVGTAPYAQTADFSPEGQKKAWEHVQNLKKNIRL